MLVFFESVLVCILEYVFSFGGCQYYTYDFNHCGRKDSNPTLNWILFAHKKENELTP